MEDVDKLDNIQDCFIHYQLLPFCQATRLQYLNGQVQLANQQVFQQQHVDHKIANALLKKGTRAMTISVLNRMAAASLVVGQTL